MGDIGRPVKEYEFEPLPEQAPPIETTPEPVVVPEEAPEKEEVPV